MFSHRCFLNIVKILLEALKNKEKLIVSKFVYKTNWTHMKDRNTKM